MEEIKSHSTKMVIVAHADDAEWGCAGTVALWVKQGIQVVYVLCTDGSKGSDDLSMTSIDLVRIRKSEQMAAAEILGVRDVEFLGYEDSMLEPTLDLRRDITKVIRLYRPETIITTNPVRTLEGEGYFGHPDHLAAGEATMSAIFPAARDRLTFPELLESGLEPHKVNELLIIGMGGKADYWVDVTETIDTAVESLCKHKSQVDPETGADHMRKWRGSVGALHGVEYAEAFKRFRLD